MWFREGVTWTLVTSAKRSFRLLPSFATFDKGGSSIFFNSADDLKTSLLFLNTGVAEYLLDIFNTTINLQVDDVRKLPITPSKISVRNDTCDILVGIARADWDNFETSCDFRDQPLLRPGLKGATLEASWRNWEVQSAAAIRQMQELETENNRLFIAAYGLDGELQPEVPEEQITLARADPRKDMAALLSYAVGCMFGRYSLDQPGLILADAGVTARDYLVRIPHPTFAPDTDGILPVLDGDWFPYDIVERFRKFLCVAYSEATLAENLAFIEASLGKELRRYFVRDFYKDHLKTYKKRPIYWMFSSPEGSFQALIYLHRYTRDTVNLLLNEYVREFVGKLEDKHRQLTSITLHDSARPGDRTKAAKDLGKIDKTLKELRAWDRDVLLPLAHQRIELDLDDGVKVNYLKFKGAVVNIPGLDKGEEE